MLLRNARLRRPWLLLLGIVKPKGVIQHDGLAKGTGLSFPEVINLGLYRRCHGTCVDILLHIGGQLQHGELHRGLLLLHRRIRVQDVLLGGHEPAGCDRGRSTKSDILNELRFLDRSPSGGRRSLHLGRVALRLHHALW